MRVGRNHQVNSLLPLAFLDRYLIYEPGDIPLISVAREEQDGLLFEIYKNETCNNRFTEVEKLSSGIINVSDKLTKKFIYKIHLSTTVSIVFGTYSTGYVTAIINDKEIKVDTNTFSTNILKGLDGGILLSEDGIRLGDPLPPFLKKHFRNARMVSLPKHYAMV